MATKERRARESRVKVKRKTGEGQTSKGRGRIAGALSDYFLDEKGRANRSNVPQSIESKKGSN
jgi:hypothetical protein